MPEKHRPATDAAGRPPSSRRHLARMLTSASFALGIVGPLALGVAGLLEPARVDDSYCATTWWLIAIGALGANLQIAAFVVVSVDPRAPGRARRPETPARAPLPRAERRRRRREARAVPLWVKLVYALVVLPVALAIEAAVFAPDDATDGWLSVTITLGLLGWIGFGAIIAGVLLIVGSFAALIGFTAVATWRAWRKSDHWTTLAFRTGAFVASTSGFVVAVLVVLSPLLYDSPRRKDLRPLFGDVPPGVDVHFPRLLAAVQPVAQLGFAALVLALLVATTCFVLERRAGPPARRDGGQWSAD